MDDPIAIAVRFVILTVGSALAVAWPRWWTSRHRVWVLSACCPVAIGLACAVSVALAHGAPNLPPVSAADRLMIIVAPLGALLGVLGAWLPLPRWRRGVLHGVAALLLTPVLLHGTVYLVGDQAWPIHELVLRSSVAAAVIVAGMMATERLATARTRRLPLWVAAGVGLGASGVAMCSGSFTIGIANLGLTAALLGAGAATLGGAGMRVACACAPVAVLLQGAFLIWGVYMAEVRPWHATALLLAPVAAGVIIRGPARRWPGGWATLAGAAAAAVVALIPTVDAVLRFIAEHNRASGY